jgi:Glycosyl hydrolases family 16
MRKLFFAVVAAALFGPVIGVLAPPAPEAHGPAAMLAARTVPQNHTPAPVLVKEFPAQAPVAGSSPPVLVKEFPARGPASTTPSPTSQPSPGEPSPVTVPSPTANGPWKLVWSTDFPVNAPLGSFGGGGNGASVNAPDLPSSLQSQWGAYPSGWPDTATQRDYPVGGDYDPATTVWISGGQMHIRMWRGASGPVHSAALVPMAASGRTYGKYIETFRVSKIAAGYKSAHLLWPSNGNQNTTSFEVDYPENEWDLGISAYVHDGDAPQQEFDAGVNWSSWHTTEIDWTPQKLSFYMDGKLIGSTTNGVPNVPMDWIIQNESALNGESAAPNSSAQIDISHVAYYSYTG